MTHPRKYTKKVLAAVAAVAALSACTPQQGQEFQAINSTRRTTGHLELQWSEEVGDVAQAYAEKLVAEGFPLAHNPFLARQLNEAEPGWLAAAENVGCGPDQFSVFTGYVFSEGHRRNLLADAWDVVGTGVARRDGKTCTVQVFVDMG